MSRPVVAVVGRPNVGKSTLLNRVLGRQEAIVEARPGVTRDRKAVDADWAGRAFTLVDTGGWIDAAEGIDAAVSRQSERAVQDADAVLFVVDARAGATADDDRVAALLRRSGRPVLVVANKVEDRSHEQDLWELARFGLGDAHPISALHGTGTGDLLDALVAELPDEDEGALDPAGPDPHDDLLGVAIVGRPNVGKSTLFNRLIREERSVVHDTAGTTRDAVDTVVQTDDGPVRFIDTAGMRRKSRIGAGAEYYSLVRALRAVDDADIAVLVIDATEGVTHQDQRLAERVSVAGCPVVVLLNKWDLADEAQREDALAEVGRRLHFIGAAPVLRVSALSGKGVQKLLPALLEARDAYHRRMPTADVNTVLRRAQAATPAPAGGRVLYATQGATDPPTFTLFVNKELPRTYLRYLERRLKEAFDLGTTPIKLRVRVKKR